MRRAFALAVVGVALGASGSAQAAGESVTLEAGRDIALHETNVRFSGEVDPADEGTRVHLYRLVGGSLRVLARIETNADGRWRVTIRLRNPGPFLARASVPVPGDDPVVVESEPVQVRVKPRLRARFVGTAVVGHRLSVRGRLLPASAGRLTRRIHGEVTRVRVGRYGGFEFRVSTADARRVRAALRLRPSSGFTTLGRTKTRRLRLPHLATGSHGRPVRALERLLKERQYALRGADGRYGVDTAQAVLAFQKVHGLARTGRMTPRLWRRLTRSERPKARVPRGTHIEISKTDQTLYEVRRGKVVNVLHTSTGATGNTPVGRWRVYGKVPGYNGSHMYYSLFFLRGFAIHGYRSVPAWPASHGCARIPLWAAPGLYYRWGHGSRIIVFG